MPAGFRDFGGSIGPDSSEVASRINKGVAGGFRTGNWLFLEEWDSTALAHWTQMFPAQPGAIDATLAYRGASSLKLITAALINDTCGVYRIFPLPQSPGRVGIEAMIYQTSGFQFWIDFNFQFFTTRNGAGNIPAAYFTLRQAAVSGHVEFVIFHGAASTEQIIDSNVQFQVGRWYNIKAVIDLDANVYRNFFINNNVYGLTSYNLAALAAPFDSLFGLYTSVDVTTKIAAAKQLNVDDLVLTINEP